MKTNNFFYIGIVILLFIGIYDYFMIKRKKRLAEAKKNIDDFKNDPLIGFSKLQNDFKFVGENLYKGIDEYESKN